MGTRDSQSIAPEGAEPANGAPGPGPWAGTSRLDRLEAAASGGDEGYGGFTNRDIAFDVTEVAPDDAEAVRRAHLRELIRERLLQGDWKPVGGGRDGSA